MKIYFKYIFSSLFKVFLLNLGVLAIVIILFRLISLFNSSINSLELDVFTMVKFVIVLLPSIINYLSPIALVCGLLYYYHHFMVTNQMLILEVSGLSWYKLVKPYMYLVGLTTLFVYVLNFSLGPMAKKELIAQRDLLRASLVKSVLVEKSFSKISNEFIIYIENKSLNGKLHGIIIFDQRVPEKPTVVLADSGDVVVLADDVSLVLHHGSRQSASNGALDNLYFDVLTIEVPIPKLDRNKIKAGLKTDPETFYISEFIKHYKTNGSLNHKEVQELNKRLSWPLFNITLSMLFLCIILSAKHARDLKFQNVIPVLGLVTVVVGVHFWLMNKIYLHNLYLFLLYFNHFAFWMICLILLKKMYVMFHR